MSTEIEVNNCFVIMTFQIRMKIFYFNLTFIVAVNLQPKDFLKSFISCIRIF